MSWRERARVHVQLTYDKTQYHRLRHWDCVTFTCADVAYVDREQVKRREMPNVGIRIDKNNDR